MSLESLNGMLFYSALSRAGLTHIYPGDSMTVGRRDADSSAQTIAYVSRMQYRYVASRTDSAIIVIKKSLSIYEVRCIVNGVLETSLFEAMQNEGLGSYLACKLSDIFAWDINFFLDPRKGDTFQILFTRKFSENQCTGYGEVLAARYVCNGKEFFAIGFPDSSGGPLQYYDCEGKSVQKQFIKAPLRYSRISSGFTYRRRHPILGIVRPHLGIDYAAPTGTPVHAAADGKIISAGWKGDYGKMVAISHGGAYTTFYGHLSRIARGIRTGAYVKQGQTIGSVGATGLATGPHLDYRMHRYNRPVNPLTIIIPSKEGIGQEDAAEFFRIKESCLAQMNHRCPDRTGYFVLELEHVSSRDTAQHYLSPLYSVSTSGIRSGS